jgi:hypothetical protein
MRYVDNVDIMVPDVDVSQIQDFIRSIDSSEPPILDEALIVRQMLVHGFKVPGRSALRISHEAPLNTVFSS